MRHSRRVCSWFLALVAVLACGRSEPETLPNVAAPPPSLSAAQQEALSGTYWAEGVTVQALSGRHREISGTLTLHVSEGRYEVEFDLGTVAPDLENEVAVRVRGTGRGFIVGDVFAGTTEEWMALETHAARLDELELSATPLPARAGRNIVSTSQASFDTDGAFHILLQNYPAPGERYEPSMTVLKATREAAP